MEMDNKIAALLSRLPEDMDAALIGSQSGRIYFTGMHSSAGTLLAVRGGGAYFIIDGRYIEKARRVARNCEVILQKNLYAQIADLLRKHGAKRIGVESEYLTIADFMRYQQGLPEAEILMDGRLSVLISELRSIKSAYELENICAAQKITDDAFSYLCGYIKPGMSEREIARELLNFTDIHGSQGPAFDFIVVSGPNSSMPHGVPGDRLIRQGDFLTIDFGCTINGYCSDMTRTIAIGEPSAEMRRVYDIVLRAQLAVLEAAKPGMTGAQVDAVARDIIAAEGYGDCFDHGLGHSVGIECHDGPRFTKGSTCVCAPGMVFSDEPGIYIEGKFGVRIEDIIVITEDGCRSLTHSDKKLLVL